MMQPYKKNQKKLLEKGKLKIVNLLLQERKSPGSYRESSENSAGRQREFSGKFRNLL
jgi:hypothetical protein